jgi:phosphoribosyl-ATP pyrophosphohydrolase/phosphoribosyl-AMP cyclohydrolase
MTDTVKDILTRAKFDGNGLIPAVVQDAHTREVLTVAYMNREALSLTLEKGETHFYSRSRKTLWHKGETSGNLQKVQRVSLDCDSDTVLVEVEPLGPACHSGAYSCFGVEPGFTGSIRQLYDLIAERKETRPDGSYTTRLFDEGIDKIVKKLGEEAVETVIAAKNESTQRIVEETADLLYHLLVTLVERGVTLEEIQMELQKRRKTGKRT